MARTVSAHSPSSVSSSHRQAGSSSDTAAHERGLLEQGRHPMAEGPNALAARGSKIASVQVGAPPIEAST
jgi:hypothetical protein